MKSGAAVYFGKGVVESVFARCATKVRDIDVEA
jgi:hypothetical protein